MGKGRFPGYGGGMNMNSIMKQAQKMQEDMQKLEEELAGKELESTAGGGAVKISGTADKNIKKIEIDPGLLDPEEAEMLQDLLVIAVNEFFEKADRLHSDEMNRISGGFGKMPGI